MKNNYLMSIIFCIVLTGCGGSSTETRAVDPVPILVSFDMIDSYGENTAVSNRALEVASFVDNGLFDIDWRVNSLEDYEVNVRVNSTASVYNSTLIYSEICGAGLSCDQGEDLICQYTSDYKLSCGRGPIISISHVPINLYLILEVCDLDSPYCEMEYYPVYMR